MPRSLTKKNVPTGITYSISLDRVDIGFRFLIMINVEGKYETLENESSFFSILYPFLTF